jgi:hypothetical protein
VTRRVALLLALTSCAAPSAYYDGVVSVRVEPVPDCFGPDQVALCVNTCRAGSCVETCTRIEGAHMVKP